MERNRVDVPLLRNFRFERVLNDGIDFFSRSSLRFTWFSTDPLVHSLFVLGSLPHANAVNTYSPAIISLQRTHLSVDGATTLVQELVDQVKPLENNDIVHHSPLRTSSLMVFHQVPFASRLVGS